MWTPAVIALPLPYPHLPMSSRAIAADCTYRYRATGNRRLWLIAVRRAAERGVAQRVAPGLDAAGEPATERREAAHQHGEVVPVRAALERDVAHAVLPGRHRDDVIAVVIGIVEQHELG